MSTPRGAGPGGVRGQHAEPSASALLGLHGDTTDEELRALGVDPERVLDLSVNVSPFGVAPAVRAAIAQADLSRYPDKQGLAARRALAERDRVSLPEVLLGHGAAELIWTATRALSTPGDTLLLSSPTFSEPEAAARAHGLTVVHCEARASEGFEPSAERLDAALRTHRPRLLYVCQPNNPTGRALPHAALSELVAQHPDTTFLIDQAFLSLSELAADASLRFGRNALLLRSLTKDHALAGLRVAYALGEPATLERLRRARPPWSLSSMALAAATAAAAEDAFIESVRARWLAQRVELEALLRAAGLRFVPSRTVFLLIEVADADATRTRLLREAGILVRSGTSFGLPGHIRVRASDDNARLVRALLT